MRSTSKKNRERAQVTFKSTLSVVLSLVDTFTGKGPIHLKETRIYLEEWPFQAIKKPDGYVVFTDLPAKRFTLVVETDWYTDIRREIDIGQLNPKQPITIIPLFPSTSYPLTQGMTVLRMRLENRKAEGMENIMVKTVPIGDEHAAARTGLMKQHAEDLHRIAVSSVVGSFSPGDTIQIVNKKTNEDALHVVKAYSIVDRMLTLEQPVQESFPRGSSIMPVVFGCSDERGECLLFFRPFRKAASKMMVVIGTDEQSITKEVEVPEGDMYNLGTIRFED